MTYEILVMLLCILVISTVITGLIMFFGRVLLRRREQGFSVYRDSLRRLQGLSMWLNHGNARLDRDVALVTDSSFHGAGALLYVDGSPRAVYAASTAAVSRMRNARDLRPGNEPEAEDSSSDSGMPGLEPIGEPFGLDTGNIHPIVRARYGHPRRHSFGGPTLANAQLQFRHDREARELREQELQQLEATGVIARPRRIIRRRAPPRPRYPGIPG